jgi:hypothetical protein
MHFTPKKASKKPLGMQNLPFFPLFEAKALNAPPPWLFKES